MLFSKNSRDSPLILAVCITPASTLVSIFDVACARAESMTFLEHPKARFPDPDLAFGWSGNETRYDRTRTRDNSHVHVQWQCYMTYSIANRSKY